MAWLAAPVAWEMGVAIVEAGWSGQGTSGQRPAAKARLQAGARLLLASLPYSPNIGVEFHVQQNTRYF